MGICNLTYLIKDSYHKLHNHDEVETFKKDIETLIAKAIKVEIHNTTQQYSNANNTVTYTSLMTDKELENEVLSLWRGVFDFEQIRADQIEIKVNNKKLPW